MANEITKELDFQKRIESQHRFQSSIGFNEVLEKAHNKSDKIDSHEQEKINCWRKLWRDWNEGKITKIQFDEGCNFYDEIG